MVLKVNGAIQIQYKASDHETSGRGGGASVFDVLANFLMS